MQEAREGKRVYQKVDEGGKVVFCFFIVPFMGMDVLLRFNLPPGEGFIGGVQASGGLDLGWAG